MSVQDPERNAAAPIGWHFWVGHTKAQIDQLAKDAGERVINVHARSAGPLLYNAVLVENTGVYARTSD